MKKLSFIVALLCASMMAFAAENLALNKTATAGVNADKAYQSNNGNKGDRWASNGAQHYAAVGNAAQDWWCVDLGGFYEIDSIKIWFERANPSDYDLLISNNGAEWTVIGTYDSESKYGDQAADVNLYTFDSDKIGRYVKIFARQGYSSLAYGFSMYEFEVYGVPGSPFDANRPVMVSASLSGEPTYNQVNIAVSATDVEDGTVGAFHVVDAIHGVDQAVVASAGIIAVTNLEGDITYNLSVTAVDNSGNESENAIVVNATTPHDMSIPTTSAPTPTRDAQWVRPLYSNAYTSILKHDFVKQNWGSIVCTEKAISGNDYLLYNAIKGNAIVWGENNGGANAIVAQDAYSAGGTGDNTGLDISAMDSLHMDIFSIVAMENLEIRINDNIVRKINLTDAGWQSIDIALAEPVEALNLSSVRWMKITNITNVNRRYLSIDNVYFYREAIQSDTQAPTNVSAEHASSEYLTITLDVSGEDNNNTVIYTVKLNDVVKGSATGSSNETKHITITGLEDNTEYTFSVIAKDLFDNAADPVNVVASTKAFPAAASAPTASADDVLSLYSNTYEPATTIGNYCENWWGTTSKHDVTLSGSNDALYFDNIQENASFGWALPSPATFNPAGFQKLHLSIYPLKAGTIDIWPVLGDSFHEISGTLTAETWNDVVLDYTDREFSAFTQLGFRSYHSLGAFILDNVYFFKETATSIDNTNADMKVVKVIENGQLVIIKNGVRYNALGAEVR